MNRNMLLLALVLTFASVACQPNSPSNDASTAPYSDLDVAAFKAKMAEDDVVILDVRTPAETDQGIIEGAVLIDINGPEFAEKVSQLDKDATYLVYCKSGGRSARACDAMAEEGFGELYNLLGGYEAWVEEE